MNKILNKPGQFKNFQFLNINFVNAITAENVHTQTGWLVKYLGPLRRYYWVQLLDFIK